MITLGEPLKPPESLQPSEQRRKVAMAGALLVCGIKYIANLRRISNHSLRRPRNRSSRALRQLGPPTNIRDAFDHDDFIFELGR